MATNGISFGGLISGLSTSDLIAKMLELERAPITRMQARIQKVQERAGAMKDVNTRLSNLYSVIRRLNLKSTLNARSATTDTPSSSPALLTATANADAALGSFIVRVQALATATSVSSAGAGGAEAIGNAVTANVPLADAGFSLTPTTGTFSVNGATITIDADTVLSDGVDALGANTIFAKIRDATSGLAVEKRVSVSWGLDAEGRQNRLVLSAAGNIQLGSGSDTSNFLTAAGLLALPSSTTMTSARNLGGANTGEYLGSADANLSIALSSTTGKFKINGVEISYDGSKDSLNAVLNRISSSAANVIASYDSMSDRVTLTARSTGSQIIDLEDVEGNFLAAMKLSESSESLGSNASYLLNGQQRYSTSNAVTDALPGITLNLLRADTNTDVTVNVSQDVTSAVAAVNDFISQYNSTMSFIREKTAYDANQKKAAILTGDPTIMAVQRSLSSMVSGFGDGLSSVARSLSDVGITTGAGGSAVGTTDLLILDTAKLTEKLQSNPNAVADLFGGLGIRSELVAGGTGSIASISGSPSNHISGSYAIASDAAGNLTVTFTPAAGGSPVVKTGTITAGGTNTTLIPGMVITAKPVLMAGTDTIEAEFSPKGVGIKIADYLSILTSAGGLFANSQEASDGEIDRINKAIQRLEERLADKEAALTRKFAALEAALARFQTQSSSLSQQLAQLSGRQQS